MNSVTGFIKVHPIFSYLQKNPKNQNQFAVQEKKWLSTQESFNFSFGEYLIIFSSLNLACEKHLHNKPKIICYILGGDKSPFGDCFMKASGIKICHIKYAERTAVATLCV